MRLAVPPATGYDARGRPALPLWLVAAFGPTLLFLAFPLIGMIGPPFLDWSIYQTAGDLWLAEGSPYQVPPPGWDPWVVHPYLYPPTSWPLIIAAMALPAAVVFAGLVPLLPRPTRYWLLPVAVLLYTLGLPDALYLANVNVLMAGLLALSFVPGRVGGLALALAVGIKLYPIVLLPLLWHDRERLRWFLAGFSVLLLSGTLAFGVQGWEDWLTTLLREGEHPAVSWNPFTDLGFVRVIPAAVISLAGIAIRSPTLTLVGATWASGVVTSHYLITFAALLPFEDDNRVTAWAARRVRGDRL